MALLGGNPVKTTPFGTSNCESLAPNYRMTELQGAVGIAQLVEKLKQP